MLFEAGFIVLNFTSLPLFWAYSKLPSFNISILDFISDKGEESCVKSHNEAANKDIFYFDKITRPNEKLWKLTCASYVFLGITLTIFFFVLIV